MSIDVLDPELPFLASQAAVELDSLIRGSRHDVTATRMLAARLRETIHDTGRSESVRELVADTATVTVLGQALNTVDTTQQLSSLDELADRTDKIVNQLSEAIEGRPEGDVEWARAFCLALSRCAAAYRKSVYDLRQPHPYRR